MASDSPGENNGNDWKKDFTLGGKESPFWWRIDRQWSIHIKRQFKSATQMSGEITVEREITSKELSAIHEYVAKNAWTDLANNVEKLSAGTEKEGLGKLMYELLHNKKTGKKDTKDGQLASHLAAVFVKAKVWESNGTKRGMQFRVSPDSWKSGLQSYHSEPSDDELE